MDSKLNFQIVRFGDMVHNINERILPEDAEGLPYVGLEHLDPESLKLRRWGTPDEVEAQKLRFYAGDIIFGKRRYYQKKLAVADFDGICSAHAMVLRAKPEVVLPDFLPFFMQSEMFFERAMSISVGSLSPTINWSALARQEFPLPPLEEQRHIAEILWALEDVIDIYTQVLADAELAKVSVIDHLITHGIRPNSLQDTSLGKIPSHWTIDKITNLVKREPNSLLAGPFGTIFKAKDFREEGIPIIQIRHLTEKGFDWGEKNLTFMDLEVYKRVHTPYTVVSGDLLVAKFGDPPGVACIYPSGQPNAMITPDVIKCSLNPMLLDKRYAVCMYNSLLMKKQLTKLQKTGTRPRMTLNDFYSLPLPIPPIEEQKEIATVSEEFDSSIKLSRIHIDNSQMLKRRLLADYLMPEAINV
jgi:restriction endonuclease S subunit